MGLITRTIAGNFCFEKDYKEISIPVRDEDSNIDEDDIDDISLSDDVKSALAIAGIRVVYLDINYAE